MGAGQRQLYRTSASPTAAAALAGSSSWREPAESCRLALCSSGRGPAQGGGSQGCFTEASLGDGSMGSRISSGTLRGFAVHAMQGTGLSRTAPFGPRLPDRLAPKASASFVGATLDTGGPQLAAGEAQPCGGSEEALGPAELQEAARMARLSGLCYLPSNRTDEVEARLAAEGMRLVASGDTYYTRWGPLLVSVCCLPDYKVSLILLDSSSSGFTLHGGNPH